MATKTTERGLRVKFLEYLFGEQEGYICIATANKLKGNFKEQYFEWPKQKPEIDSFIDFKTANFNIWFGVNLLSTTERRKENCLPSQIVWSDLDYVDPDEVNPPPACVIESSPKRYQAFWRLENYIPPDVAEDFSKRIAYANGADRSGWPLTKLLRVPHTLNFKYENPPQVRVIRAAEIRAPINLFETIKFPEDSNSSEAPIEDMPDDLPSVENVLYAYRGDIEAKSDGGSEAFVRLYSQEPAEDSDWSARLWRLINMCIEAGMQPEETLTIAIDAKCNKYKRDNRPMSYLWKEVNKAYSNSTQALILQTNHFTELEMPQLVDPDEVEEDSLVVDYKRWGDTATDAPMEYHELSCFVALSCLVSSGLKLKTSFGPISPNIWGLILGESTLTRKTTAMRMAMDIVTDLNPELVVATSDGSAEGLLTALSVRPQRVSVFFKDEVSGLFESMNKKDYLAGMRETLTQLYDVPKILTRPLRRETVTIAEPYFVFFGGGIRDKIYSLLDEVYVISGFIPRFLVVSGENDFSRIRRTGPPTEATIHMKDKIINSFGDLKVNYNLEAVVDLGGGSVMKRPVVIDVEMTPDAWELYGDLEMLLVKQASEAVNAMMALPTFQRLATSMLKIAILIACTRREPNDDKVLIIEKEDINQAAWYVQRWGKHSVQLISNAGKPYIEKVLDKIVKRIRDDPGTTRSALMIYQRLSAREMKEITNTLLDRGLVTTSHKGRAVRFYPV